MLVLFCLPYGGGGIAPFKTRFISTLIKLATTLAEVMITNVTGENNKEPGITF